MKRGNQLDSCVFYFFNEVEPTIKRKNKIHKIVYNDFFIQNELTNQRKLLTTQNHKEHFYLCENASELKITQMRNEDTYIHGNYVQKDNTILDIKETNTKEKQVLKKEKLNMIKIYWKKVLFMISISPSKIIIKYYIYNPYIIYIYI